MPATSKQFVLCLSRWLSGLFLAAGLSAQNIQVEHYPAHQAELERFQKAFDSGGDRGESIALAGTATARTNGDRSAEAHWLRMTGASFERRGDFRKAREFYEQSLAIRRELKQPPEIILLTRGIGFVCYNMRDYPAMHRYLDEAIQLASSHGEPVAEGFAWHLKGMSEQNQQRLPQAAEAFARALDRYAAGGAAGQSGVGQVHVALARLHIDRSEFPAALREGFESLRILRTLPRRESDVAAALDAIGTVFHHLEDPRKALDYYRQALDLRTRASANPLQSFRNIGVELDKLGSHQEAIGYFEKVAAAYRKTPNTQELAGALINLAVAQQSAGLSTDARKNFSDALALLPDTGATKRQRAICLYGVGNLDIAESKVENALSRHREAHRLRGETGDALGALRSLNRIGIALEQAARWKEALDVHREAMAAFDKLLAGIADPIQAVQFRTTSQILYPHYARTLVELDRPQEALMVAERGRGTGLSRMRALNAAGTDSLDETSRKALTQAMRVSAQARNRLRIAVETAGSEREVAEVAYVEADRELSRARDGLFTSNPGLRLTARQAGQTSFDSILAFVRRQPDTLFLEWLDVDEGIPALLFAISSRDGLKVYRLPESLVAVGRSLDEWYRTLRRGQSARGVKVPRDEAASAESETALARRVYTSILGDAAQLLDSGRFKRLVLITDGPLLRTPFPALIDTKGRRLVDRLSISTALSITSLLNVPAPRSKAPRLYAVADPIPDGGTLAVVPQSLRFTPLAGAREEAVSIGRIMAGGATALGPEAREADIKQKMPGYDIVHFATHGILSRTEPMRSSLLLAAEPSASVEDGLLEAWEIASMKLSTRLAVLSACETGQGNETLSDGIMGLSWAFQAAGCPNVVASLWSIDDSATTALMVAFYKHIGSGARVDDAMRAAMLETRASKYYKYPYYWAAFQIIGPAGSMSMSFR